MGENIFDNPMVYKLKLCLKDHGMESKIFKKLLKENKFKKIYLHDVWIGENWVVKNPLIIAKIRHKRYAKLHKYVIPTVQFEDKDRLLMFIQPRVQTDRESVNFAVEAMDEDFKRFSSIDFYDNNVGVYNGKPVLIDW